MQSYTIPFRIDDARHSIRVVVSGMNPTHSIYLDDALYYCHNVKTAGGCAVYVLIVDGVKAEVLVQKLPHGTQVKVYLDDVSTDKKDLLPLSQQLEILSTASEIRFGEHARQHWRQAILKWLVWAACCTVLLGLVQDYDSWKMWLFAAGVSILPVPLGLLLDLRSSYQEIRRFRTPKDCYQEAEEVTSIAD